MGDDGTNARQSSVSCTKTRLRRCWAFIHAAREYSLQFAEDAASHASGSRSRRRRSPSSRTTWSPTPWWCPSRRNPRPALERSQELGFEAARSSRAPLIRGRAGCRQKGLTRPSARPALRIELSLIAAAAWSRSSRAVGPETSPHRRRRRRLDLVKKSLTDQKIGTENRHLHGCVAPH